MDYYHLTTPQQNIWNLQKYYEDTAIANLCGVIVYNEKRNSALLQQAICQFVRSQSGIRLRFREADELKQYVSEEVDEAVPVLEFGSMEEFDCYAERFAKEPLGLIERQMYRFAVVQIGEKTANIFNIYGPAETTVWSSNAKVIDRNITIGTPIANTQIYILDKHNRPVPIGVPGELCIAGEGVGLGYLNRPELTAEKFVPNPFATKENHHGTIMYHTGDLARWRADGEIEYLGRIDTQVKIRGLRIELGEIESVMSSMEGIRLTAVADKRDENNRQYLVGYYTADVKIDEKRLRRHLSAKLPNYMVPNYFMHLESMPMTPSGKTDRKNLPVPDFCFACKRTYTSDNRSGKRIVPFAGGIAAC